MNQEQINLFSKLLDEVDIKDFKEWFKEYEKSIPEIYSEIKCSFSSDGVQMEVNLAVYDRKIVINNMIFSGRHEEYWDNSDGIKEMRDRSFSEEVLNHYDCLVEREWFDDNKGSINKLFKEVDFWLSLNSKI